MVNRRRLAAAPAQTNGRLPAGLFVAMALFVMAVAGSRTLGVWRGPGLIELVGHQVAGPEQVDPGSRFGSNGAATAESLVSVDTEFESRSQPDS